MSKTIVTHNGKFHTDDVFAIAALYIMLGKENCDVVRTRDPDIIEKGDIVIDVGEMYDPARNRFDHHQRGGAADRPNGVPYASFGLVWKEYGEKICGSKEIADEIEQRLVQPIDAGDNGKETYQSIVDGVHPFTINTLVDSYRPTWKEEEDWDGRFFECVDWATTVLNRQIKISHDWDEGKKIIFDIYKNTEDKRLIVIGTEHRRNFGRELVMSALSPLPEPLYAVFHRHEANEWQVVAMREELGTFRLKKPLPEAWAAKRDKELQELTGTPDAVFCHKGGFMCMVRSKESALVLAKKALES